MWLSVRILVPLNKFQKNSFRNTMNVSVRRIHTTITKSCNKLKLEECHVITIFGKNYIRDEYTNVTPHVLSLLSHNLHLVKNHPLNLIKQRIVRYMYGSYLNRRGNPLFSVYDKLAPVVTVQQNFDSLLIPEDHPSRKKSDSYYINSNYLLRPHTSAHQKELIMSGLDHFLVIGDVYRRDEIDAKHYPVFHQCEGVRLLSPYELFSNVPNGEDMKLFLDDVRRAEKQGCHTMEATKLMEKDLKGCLVGLIKRLFGESIEYRWAESYFPFTHPSWELEIKYKGDWLEVLGCGIMEQEILNRETHNNYLDYFFRIALG
ncbi:phenylalanine--tRNA ligase, mitochondrial-like [Stegodyphus dumicola]|uniref:phenylalanine--tRNA ligase, mitochondrial-like n=1 Tax=Stegodyphus dumicola TaxID=202533 RepID=UPI0015A82699|nr:phenylalanine--tRNA ligase, mitochondrial-like [Stegodyphus dumicola]